MLQLFQIVKAPHAAQMSEHHRRPDEAQALEETLLSLKIDLRSLQPWKSVVFILLIQLLFEQLHVEIPQANMSRTITSSCLPNLPLLFPVS